MASVTAVNYVAPAELAERYHVSKRTVLYWVANGTITPAFRRGKILRFIAEDVDQELKSTEGAAGVRGEA